MNLAAESPKHLAEPGGLHGARLPRPVQKKKAFPIFGGNHLTDINPFGGRRTVGLKLIVTLQTQGESIKGPFVIN